METAQKFEDFKNAEAQLRTAEARSANRRAWVRVYLKRAATLEDEAEQYREKVRILSAGGDVYDRRA